MRAPTGASIAAVPGLALRIAAWIMPLRAGASFAAVLCVTGLWSISSATVLKFDAKNLSDGKVEFKSGPCFSAPAPGADQQPMPQAEATSYVVLMNPAKTLPGVGYFVYEFYVQPKGGGQQPGGPGCSVRVQGLPSGTFVDQTADITFHVGSEGRLEDGTIRIPLYNTRPSKPIVDYQVPTLSGVSLSGQSPIEIGISNSLTDLPVGLYKDIAVHSDGSDLWQDAPQAALQLPRSGPALLQPGQKLATGILLTLRPKPWHALGTSMFPLAPEKPHATLTLHLNYDSPGGIPGLLEIPVPIRFRPSFWSLLLAVVVGSLLGAAFAQLVSATAPKWYKAFSVAIIAGLLVEVVGMLLVNAKSEFRLFNINLDPYQLSPALVVGALVGVYGFRKADDLLALFKKKVGP
jgi:hypothetical protein